MGKRPGHRREEPPKDTTYAGLTTCLRCDALFKSWDRRQNRLCEKCREAIRLEPSDEPSYRLPKSKGRPREVDDG